MTACDNRDALVRLSRDPLTLHETRISAVRGLVDLMDAAAAAAPTFRAPGLFMYGGHDELVPKEATATMWRQLPSGARRAYYPDHYHLMLRDRRRDVPLDDVVAWVRDPRAKLPSGADRIAADWLVAQA